jgi:molybdopterin converting factor small subunit
MAKIIIPTPLRGYVNNQPELEVKGNTVKEVLQILCQNHPKLKSYVFDDQGDVREFIKIYVGDTDSIEMDLDQTKVDTDIEISIIPAIAGGNSY